MATGTGFVKNAEQEASTCGSDLRLLQLYSFARFDGVDGERLDSDSHAASDLCAERPGNKEQGIRTWMSGREARY